MKKLTAGILASLIGLVSANSADAAVASTKYVEDRIEVLDATYVGATEATNNFGFVAGVSEEDGKIQTTGGQLALKENTADYTNTLTIEKVKEVDGSFTYKIGAAQQTDNDTKYTEGNGVTISEGNVISADIAEGDNVKITTDAEGKMTISATDTNTTLNDYTDTGDTGLQVLTRKLADDGSYVYMWETIDRDYSETQPAQPTQE